MSKSGAQAVKLPMLNLQKNTEIKFPEVSETKEISIVEKVSEKLKVNIRFSRLRRRMRNRSSNIF